MKNLILVFLACTLMSFVTAIDFFYYNSMRKAIAIRDTEKGILLIKNYSNQVVMQVEYPANQSRWISVARLASGLYTAQSTSGVTINFYKRP